MEKGETLANEQTDLLEMILKCQKSVHKVSTVKKNIKKNTLSGFKGVAVVIRQTRDRTESPFLSSPFLKDVVTQNESGRTMSAGAGPLGNDSSWSDVSLNKSFPTITCSVDPLLTRNSPVSGTTGAR